MDEIARFFENSDDDLYCIRIAEQLEGIVSNIDRNSVVEAGTTRANSIADKLKLSASVREQLTKVRDLFIIG